MKFNETGIKNVYIIEPERLEDNRGFFARTYCEREFSEHGINSNFVQCNISFNKIKGTLRGMHFQSAPHKEVKLVRCTMGAIYDVVVDLRCESDSFKKWISVELTSHNRKMIYIPEDVAHGFLTLEDNTEVFYQMSEFYAPESATGIRWDDPVFGIQWPADIKVISDRDSQYIDFKD